jgi:hypothetical protein
MKPKGLHDLPISIRAIIIAFQVFCGFSFVEISRKLGIHQDTARKFYNRTHELAQSPAFWELLAVYEPLTFQRCHPDPMVPPGSQLVVNPFRLISRNKIIVVSS